MGKFNNRVNKLIVKTHGFISYHDLCILRDYYKKQCLKIDTPVNYDDLFKENVELIKKYDLTFDVEIKAEIREKVDTNFAILANDFYQYFVIQCAMNPNGVWVKKSVAEEYKIFIYREKNNLVEIK